MFESSIYDFRISSLPKIDLNFSSAEGTMGNLIRIKIGKTTGSQTQNDRLDDDNYSIQTINEDTHVVEKGVAVYF